MKAISTLQNAFTDIPKAHRWKTVAVLGAAGLAAPLLSLLVPTLVWGAAGCAGTTIKIQNLDDLLQTAWEYLTSGAVIRILAAAFFIFGVGALISRRPAAAVMGILAGAVAAFLPTILDTFFKSSKATLALCG